ncbi:odorant receptor 4-like [Euwallacea similis]|uniref:odorant receptor 4-like n=1 Tax=Euwallacea similis TaxID=1736056 RepID=UPI00344E4947
MITFPESKPTPLRFPHRKVSNMFKNNFNIKFFKFNIFVLKTCGLWPSRLNYEYTKCRLLKDSVMILSLLPCFFPILADFIKQLYEKIPNLTEAVENMIALNCLIGMFYMVVCFIRNRRTIMRLMIAIKYFDQYGNQSITRDVDNKANFLSKVFMFYGILGNFVYMAMPQLSVHRCTANRTLEMIEQGIPCGLVVRSLFPFKFDYSPIYQIIFVHQIYTCTMVSVVVLVLTMLLCGFLMHIVNQLQNLRKFIKNLSNLPQEIFLRRLICVINYHIEIIQYSQQTCNAFSTMLLFYISLTSVVLSVLCFEVIMVDDIEDSVRFTLHLLGWLVILLSISYNGQKVIDTSTQISHDIYCLDWFMYSADVQKKVQTVIMRAQKPLVMDAAGMGIVSLPAFLKVLSSAYSFFTLLLKIK